MEQFILNVLIISYNLWLNMDAKIELSSPLLLSTISKDSQESKQIIEF